MARAKPDATYQEYSQHLDQFTSKLPEEVLRKIEFFDDILQTYDMWTVLACLKLLSLVTLMPNQQVFQRDEISKSFWVLLSGEALISDSNNHMHKNKKLFKIGESEGNFDDQMMQYSLRTVLKCEFAVLRKEQYEFVVQKRDENEHKRIIKLLKNTTVFEDFQMVILKKNIGSFAKKIYNYNTIVYDENQPIDGIYIIDSGQFSVMKSKVIDNTKQGKDQDLPTNKAFVKLSVLQQQSQVFGQEEIFRAKSHRRNRVICTQNNSKVFFLSIDHYMEMFKSTSNKTIHNLIQKEKNSQQMRESIIERRQKLDQNYKHFLYQSSVSPPNHNLANPFKYYDPESLAELQQLQVPSTKKNHYLPAINQNSRQQSLENQRTSPDRNDKNEIIQELVLHKQDSSIHSHQNSLNNSKVISQPNHSNGSTRKRNSNSNINVNIIQSMNNVYYNNNSPKGSKIQLNDTNPNSNNQQMVRNNSMNQGNMSSKQNLQNISGSNNQILSQTQIDDNFLEENDILEIQQKQKMQNIQEILEKNKHLCQSVNFIKDEDVLLELQRNKTNNTTLNLILNRNRSNSIKRHSIIEKNEGKTPGNLQKERSFYDVDTDNTNKQQIQRSNKINKNSESIFKPKTNNNIILSQSKIDDTSTFLITQQNSQEDQAVMIKNETSTLSNQINQSHLPQIQQDNSINISNNSSNFSRRRSLRQHLLADQVRKRQQNFSFHNIYDVQDQRYQQLSHKEQLSKLNKSEEIITNQSNFNQMTNQQRQYLSVYANPYNQLNDNNQKFVQYKDIQHQKPSREVSMTQIYEDVSPEKIKNLNLDAIEYQMTNQSELMRLVEHEIKYAITGPKNKLIENYIGKYIKRSNKRKQKDGYEMPSLLDTLKKDNSMLLNNSIEIINDQYSQQYQSNVNLISEVTALPQLNNNNYNNNNNSNFKSFMGGIQPQNSINKQFLRKSRKKIKQKLQKAIEEKLLDEQQPQQKRSPSPTQKNNPNYNNKSNASIQQINPFISPKNIIKATPKLHTIILGIDKYDIVKD